MAEGSARKEIQVTVGKALSTAIIQGVTVEVSPDSNVVVYTNDGVQTKPAAVETAAKGTHISEDFNILVLNGATIERAADGHLIISTPGSVITKPSPANDPAAKARATPQIGDTMPAGHPNAGWIYAGVSNTSNQPLYVAPKDSGLFQWKAAMEFAAKEGARVPSMEELNQIYEAKDEGALKGTFNVTSSNPGWYWSSSQSSSDYAWGQRLNNGLQHYYGKDGSSSLRCVR